MNELYSFRKEVPYSYEQAIKKAKEALKKEGFGVLTEIDVKATLKNKLDVDFDNYIILGVCNPMLAHKALKVEREIGLFLPCNVIVYENKSKVFVSAIRPTVAMSMINNKDLKCVADEAEPRLKKAIESLGGRT